MPTCVNCADKLLPTKKVVIKLFASMLTDTSIVDSTDVLQIVDKLIATGNLDSSIATQLHVLPLLVIVISHDLNASILTFNVLLPISAPYLSVNATDDQDISAASGVLIRQNCASFVEPTNCL